MATAAYPFRSAAHHGDLNPAGGKRTPFPLLRWFALLSAAAVLFVLITGTLFLNRFVERVSLLQSADGLTGLINSIVEVEQADRFFLHNGKDQSNEFHNFLIHLGRLPGVMRANVYDRDGLVLWSSDPGLIGQHFPDNDELNAALAGTSVVSAGSVGEDDDKAEHVDLAEPGKGFVENYLPVWSAAAGPREVVGAIEVYRRPVQLLAAIEQTQMQIWWGAIAVTLLLYAALCGIVARAARVMRLQQMALVAAEKLALAGEMASAVAHGLRNPLASIRSTAELGLETDDRREVQGLLAEVVAQSDRLEGWIRQFLTTARSGSPTQTPTDARAVIADCARQFEPTLARRGMRLELALPDDLPRISLCPIILRQILNSVLANAIEAMAHGGRLSIGAAAVGHSVAVQVGDTGIGMSAGELETALEPFATTKSQGLGLGLPLARETLERHGGSLHIESQPGTGTTVHIVLPAVEHGA